jgi:uncharacterized lipoprotein YddW (UPF0748 family)
MVFAEKVGIIDCQTKWSSAGTWKPAVEMLGYEVEMVTPERLQNREDISSYPILVAADTVLTEEEMSGLKAYVEGGGKLLLLGNNLFWQCADKSGRVPGAKANSIPIRKTGTFFDDVTGWAYGGVAYRKDVKITAEHPVTKGLPKVYPVNTAEFGRADWGMPWNSVDIAVVKVRKAKVLAEVHAWEKGGVDPVTKKWTYGKKDFGMKPYIFLNQYGKGVCLTLVDKTFANRVNRRGEKYSMDLLQNIFSWFLVKDKKQSANKMAYIYDDQRQYYKMVMARAIEGSGVPYVRVSSKVAELGILKKIGYKIVILECPAEGISDKLESKLEEFLESGGRMLLFLPPFLDADNRVRKLIRLLGCKQQSGKRNVSPNTLNFEGVFFSDPGLWPGKIDNVPYMIPVIEPVDAAVIASWHDVKGKKSYPAIFQSDKGLIIDGPFTAGSPFEERQFIAQAVLKLSPGYGKLITDKLKTSVNSAIIRWEGKGGEVEAYVNKAKKLRNEAESLINNKKYGAAVSRLISARKETVYAHGRSMESPKKELRSIFIGFKRNNSERYWDWEIVLRDLKKAGFNALTISPYSAWSGTTYYRSDSLPWKDNVKKSGKEPLGHLIDSARDHGLGVHTYFSSFAIFHDSKIEKKGVAGDWFMRTAEGAKYRDGRVKDFCRSHPEVREEGKRNILEVVRKFPGLAGIQYDYIRFTGRDTCYCDHCKKVFQKETGIRITKWPDAVLTTYKKEYGDWQASLITRFVKDVSKEAKKINPGLKIGADVLAGVSNAVAHRQYWWEWKGSLDYVAPMTYSQSLEKVNETLRKDIGRGKEVGMPVVPIIALHTSAGTLCGDPDLLLDIIEAARKDTVGVAAFAYSKNTMSDYWIDLFSQGPFRNCQWGQERH